MVRDKEKARRAPAEKVRVVDSGGFEVGTRWALGGHWLGSNRRRLEFGLV